ncbi:helix-turn-helix domain-containing protein [Metallosphaera sp.]|nr:helix-turn-helix domain containing protein [Metallosphaera sedula]
MSDKRTLMPDKRIYVELFSGMVSEADIVNILGYIKDEASIKELEEKSGISRKTIYNWLHGKVETISKESRRKFLEVLLDIAGVDGLLHLARSKRVAYVRLLGALLENGADVSELQVIVHGSIITNKIPNIQENTIYLFESNQNSAFGTNEGLLSPEHPEAVAVMRYQG